MSTTDSNPEGGANAARSERVTPDELYQICHAVKAGGGRLVSLWASDQRGGTAPGFVLSVALQDTQRLRVVELSLDRDDPTFPDLSSIFYAAGRLQRAAFDLVGAHAAGGDSRPWLRHGAWPADVFPLRHDALQASTEGPDPYVFVRVEGEGVHEIPVGPVHAGIIEPGHFRFSIVGEKVLRLEERLGYVHKGIEKRFESMRLEEGVRLAARVSGDSAVAFSWAYCVAVEQATDTEVPARAQWLRALCLERERLANHLGDLGALGNDAGFAFGQAQFTRLKEDLLRANSITLGQRYLNDAVVPGGVAFEFDDHSVPLLLEQLGCLAAEVAVLHEIYDNHAGVQDRFVGAGILAPELAAELGIAGLAGRASGQTFDLRCDAPSPPYDVLAVQRAVRPQGDVAARVAVRFDEVVESIRLSKALLTTLPGGASKLPFGSAEAGRCGYGRIEGWRGPVFVALTTGVDGGIARCHPHDPSWETWVALEHAVIGNIVPDFPLINKSFNLSYSGHDL